MPPVKSKINSERNESNAVVKITAGHATIYDNDILDVPAHAARAIVAHVLHRVAAEDGDINESTRQYTIFLEGVKDGTVEVDGHNDSDVRDIIDLYPDAFDDEYYDKVEF